MLTNQISAAKRCKNDLVQIRKGKAVTSSMQVAKMFGKDHADVLKSIRKLDCSPEFIAGNFTSYHYFSELNENVIRKLPMYYLTRDGFTFLVMGFTGKLAARFKEAYIEAFNEMERVISKSQEGELLAKELEKFCTSYSHMVKGIHKDCNQKFGFSTHYGDMPVSLTWHSDWTLQENIRYVLPRLSNALAEGWYAAHRRIKAEKELDELRKTLSGVVDTLMNKHRILP